MKKAPFLFASFLVIACISCTKDNTQPPYNLPTILQNVKGDIYTYAGNGNLGYKGNGGTATNSAISFPGQIAIDRSGNLFIDDRYNNLILKVTTSGVIHAFAGNSFNSGTGHGGFSGDGGPATNAELNNPTGVAVDHNGNVYIADYFNCRIRMVNTSGVISTIAGNGYDTAGGSGGFSGDGGPATAAEIGLPNGVAADLSGNIYIGDTYNMRIRKVNTGGIISTFAGTGNGTNTWTDGIAATAENIIFPFGVAVDNLNNVYFTNLNRICKVTTGGIIFCVAGNENAGYSGDGGPATAAELNGPLDMAIDEYGNLYIADNDNQRIRMVTTAGIIKTVAGNGFVSEQTFLGSYSGDGGPATLAELNSPYGIAIDNAGYIYIGDLNNLRVRRVLR